jgi:monofunctional biosynthetic peptidoglycan transglycosylase
LAPRKKAPRRLLRYLLIALATVVIGSVLLVLPLRWAAPATSAFMLQDQSGRVPVAWQWSDWDAISQQAALAVIAAEDQKFTDHAGFDVDSILNSVESRRDGGRLRGASTISQQVAKNLWLWPGRSFVRKGLEAWLTVFVELCLPKQRILEIYLNIAELGPGVYGVEAASRAYFGKPAAALNRREAALLAAVLPSPRNYNARQPSAYVRNRQQWIITQMARLERQGWLTTLN